MENYAGRSDVDDALAAELEAAGISVQRFEWRKEHSHSEVNTAVFGSLHGWLFERAWTYWVARGPGLPPQHATPLHEAFGQTVRVDGHCGCPSPLEQFRGFGVGLYHVDDAAGLKALADALKQCVADTDASAHSDNATPQAGDAMAAASVKAQAASSPQAAGSPRLVRMRGGWQTDAEAVPLPQAMILASRDKVALKLGELVQVLHESKVLSDAAVLQLLGGYYGWHDPASGV